MIVVNVFYLDSMEVVVLNDMLISFAHHVEIVDIGA